MRVNHTTPRVVPLAFTGTMIHECGPIRRTLARRSGVASIA